MPLTRSAALCVGVLVWFTAVFLLDIGATSTQQHVLGAATWLVLLLALRRETAPVRVQVTVVVVYATVIEYVFSHWLPLLYVGAFGVVSYLEIVGTSLGTWTWGAVDPVLGVITIGNPPSGIAGGYAWFDAAALWLTPLVLARWSRRSGAPRELGIDPGEVVAHSRSPLEVERR